MMVGWQKGQNLKYGDPINFSPSFTFRFILGYFCVTH